MYINKILMKTILIFYITCYNVNYFVSQLVGLVMKTPWTILPAVSSDLHITMA